MINPDSMKCPPNGLFTYKEDGFEYTGEAISEIMDDVIKYRLSCEKNTQSVERDIVNQICELNPKLCKKVEIEIDDDESHEIDEAFAFLKCCEEYLQKPEIDLIATERAKICSKCHKQKKLTMNDDELLGQYNQKLIKVTSGKSMKHKKIEFCSEYGMDCRAAIYCHSKHLPKDTLPFCWINRDLADFLEPQF